MSRIEEDRARRLFGDDRIERWDVPVAALADALTRSVAKAFSGRTPSASDVDRYLRTLHLDDLVLACACALGRNQAWDHFVLEHRPVLYRAAEAIDRSGGARELADSLYADLYGVNDRGGERRSLFQYFHGRSSLATWLRAVLAQRMVDRVRAHRRLEPLLDKDAAAITAIASAPDPDRHRFVPLMHAALSAALAALPARDRLRLGCYYAQEMTLAQVGALLREHEATVSRHLTRTRRAIRENVELWLRREGGLADAEIDECFSTAASDPGPMDLAQLLGQDDGRKKTPVDRSVNEGMP